MEIIEGNKLIAEFMGGKVQSNLTVKPYPSEIPYWAKMIYDFDTLRIGGYKYHTSPDWIMPVVEKIEKFDEGVCSVFIAGTDCDIAFSSKYNKDGEDYDAPNFRKSSEDKMKSTWQAVVQFIQWYNTPKK